MISPLLPAVLLLLHAAQPPFASAQGQGVCPSGAQPLARRIDPPSGTTGTDLRRSTNYTISGEVLDAVDSIVLSLGLTVIIRASNSSSIQFHIQEANLRRGEMMNATVSLLPTNQNCLTTNFNITLLDTCELY